MSTLCKQPLIVSIAGPIGSGKTLLINSLSKQFWPTYNLAVATVESLASSLWSSCDPSTLFLQQQGILPQERIRSIAQFSALPDLEDIPGLELAFGKRQAGVVGKIECDPMLDRVAISGE